MKKVFLFGIPFYGKSRTGSENVMKTKVSGLTAKEAYASTFLVQKKSVSRKQTYISCEIYSQLKDVIPVMGNCISIPTFLNNVLEHHLSVHKNEIEFLFHDEVRKLRKTESANPVHCPSPESLEEYEKIFLIRQQKAVQRKQTYINNDLYAKLIRTLPMLDRGISIPDFWDNVLEHHLDTHKNEIMELFHEETQKMKF